MLQLLRENLHSAKSPAALVHVVIAAERIEREGVSVQVILQIKNARETRAGKLIFVPSAVGVLMLNEPCHRSFHGRIARADHGEKADQSPGRLRRRARSLSL